MSIPQHPAESFRSLRILPLLLALLLSGCSTFQLQGEGSVFDRMMTAMHLAPAKAAPALPGEAAPALPAEAAPAPPAKEPAAPAPAPAPPAAAVFAPMSSHAPAPPAAAPAPAPAPPAPAAPQFRKSRFGVPDQVYRDAVVSTDTVLRGSVLVEGGLVVQPQATLYVEAGATVRFRTSASGAPGAILVMGRLEAAGTEYKPVIFTSDLEDPAAGDWQGIAVVGSAKKNILENCRVEWADLGVDARFSTLSISGLTLSGGRTGIAAAVSNLIVRASGIFSCGTGMKLRDSDADITGLTLSGNRTGLDAAEGSLYLGGSTLRGNAEVGLACSGTRVEIAGGDVSGNGTALRLRRCRGALYGIAASGNAGDGLLLEDCPSLEVRDNRFTGNGGNGVRVASGAATLWNNSLTGNAAADLRAEGSASVAAAAGNWWGSASAAEVRGRVAEGTPGSVILFPALAAPPRPQGEKPL